MSSAPKMITINDIEECYAGENLLVTGCFVGYTDTPELGVSHIGGPFLPADVTVSGGPGAWAKWITVSYGYNSVAMTDGVITTSIEFYSDDYLEDIGEK